MNDSPRVSVVTPTYNRAHLLPRAIRSVLKQSYQNLEMIIVDDGSTDDTLTIIDQFNDHRVRVVRFERNRGIGTARNEGVRQARGEFIAFIDSDDVWLPDKIANQVAFFDRHPTIEILFGNYININHSHSTLDDGFKQTKQALSLLKVTPIEPDWFIIEDGISSAILIANFFATPTVMIRKSVFPKIGNFEIRLSGPEDFEFWWRASTLGIRFAYTTRMLIERHKDDQSITSDLTAFTPRYLKALEFCENTARASASIKLIPAIRRAKHRVICGLALEYTRSGHHKAACLALLKSLRFGFSVGVLRCLGAIAIGPRMIQWIRHRGKSRI
jgi:glycosyltransferase involved in cell wall biosynthesis